jgi:predicted DsbA family dithiol-disulfide isomerase
VNVTRHPFSFRGGQRPPNSSELDITWKWNDDLNIYAGDEIEQYLSRMGITHSQIRQLRAPGGLPEALKHYDADDANRRTVQTLEHISRAQGYDAPWTIGYLKSRVAEITPEQLARPRGKQVGELDVIAGDEFKNGLRALGRSVDIDFDFNVLFRWYPVDSQRALLYAARFGAQEAFADAMARRHFTQGMASGSQSTVLDAAQEVGLDVEEVKEMLASDEYVADVWKSYEDTVGKYNIHSIPFFTFNGPRTNGGIFRKDGMNSGETMVRGSGNVEQFLQVFGNILSNQPQTCEQ